MSSYIVNYIYHSFKFNKELDLEKITNILSKSKDFFYDLIDLFGKISQESQNIKEDFFLFIIKFISESVKLKDEELLDFFYRFNGIFTYLTDIDHYHKLSNFLSEIYKDIVKLNKLFYLFQASILTKQENKEEEILIQLFNDICSNFLNNKNYVNDLYAISLILKVLNPKSIKKCKQFLTLSQYFIFI